MVIGLAQSDEPGEYKLTRHGEFLRCPWHGWEFDIRTGQSWFDPSKVRTRAYKTTIEPGAELVKGPYVAETFAIRVEENYVIIDI
jgi:3-phenylpropionate/trans-cinnamate dioxygenase ferredoxin subunit